MWKDPSRPLASICSCFSRTGPFAAAIGLLPPQPDGLQLGPDAICQCPCKHVAPRKQDRKLGQDHPQQEGCGDIPFSVAQQKPLPSSSQSTSKNTASACLSLLAATPHHRLKAHGRACGQAGDGKAPLTCLQAACPPPLSGSWPGTGSLLVVHQWVSVPILHYSKSGPKLVLAGGPALCWAILEDKIPEGTF